MSARKTRAKRDRDETEARRPRRHPVGGILFALAGIAVILYGAALIASRTEGFRAFAARYLEREAGVPVVLEKAWLTPGLVLHLEGVRTKDFGQPGRPGARVDHATVDLSVVDGLRDHRWIRMIAMKRVVLAFAPGEGGRGLEPAVFAEWLGAVDPWSLLGWEPGPPGARTESPPAADPAPEARPPARGMRRLPAVTAEDVTIQWWGVDENLRAELGGASFTVAPLAVPDRELLYLRIRAERFERDSGEVTGGLDAELILAGDRRSILTCRLGSPPDAP